VEADVLATEEGAEQHERLIHARAARAWIDPAKEELAAIVTAEAHAEGQPAGRDRRNGGELTRNRDRVAQAKQVDAGLDPQRRMGHEQRRRLHEAIHTHTAGEADVVAHRDVIKPGTRNPSCQPAQPRTMRLDVLLTQDDSDPHLIHRPRPRAWDRGEST
jgi:hypothetical protein